jgi:hypothetical protein
LTSDPRALGAQRLWKALCRLFMPACPGAVQCLGRNALGAVREPTYRLYNCQRCGVQVRICRRCDHGNIYCAQECSRIRRRECLRRAAARYQRTRRGAWRHAARQQAWRARQQTVTHQGYPGGELCRSVSDHPITVVEPTDAYRAASIHATSLHGSEPGARCAFCRALLPAWTRLRLWPWSG